MTCHEITALGYFVLTAGVFLTTIVKISHKPQYLQPIKPNTLKFDDASNLGSTKLRIHNSKINQNHFRKYKFNKTALENQNPNIFFLKLTKRGLVQCKIFCSGMQKTIIEQLFGRKGTCCFSIIQTNLVLIM